MGKREGIAALQAGRPCTPGSTVPPFPASGTSQAEEGGKQVYKQGFLEEEAPGFQPCVKLPTGGH